MARTVLNGLTTTTFKLIPAAGDIASPTDGTTWYNSTTGKFRKRENGVTSDLDTGGGGGESAFTSNVGFAAAGTIQTDAAAITATSNFQFVEVTTATVNQGVRLPVGTQASRIRITNKTAFQLFVWPSTGAQIDGAGANNSFLLLAGLTYTFYGTNATTWYSDKIGPLGIDTAQIQFSAVGPNQIAPIGSKTFYGNNLGVLANPNSVTITQALDWATGTPAQGNILYRNATSWQLLAPGTSGQFLQTGGAAANPVWATAGGGGVTDGDKGQITISGAGTVYTLDPEPQYAFPATMIQQAFL